MPRLQRDWMRASSPHSAHVVAGAATRKGLDEGIQSPSSPGGPRCTTTTKHVCVCGHWKTYDAARKRTESSGSSVPPSAPPPPELGTTLSDDEEEEEEEDAADADGEARHARSPSASLSLLYALAVADVMTLTWRKRFSLVLYSVRLC